MAASPSDSRLVDAYLRGEAAATRTIQTWIAEAAAAFRGEVRDGWADVEQEARREALRLLGDENPRGDTATRTAVWRATCHTCLDHLRARRRRRWTDLEGLPELAAPDDQSPARRAEERDDRALLLRVLTRMPAECRQLWGWILGGASYRDLAELVGVGEEALRERVLRCRRRAVAARDQLRSGGPEGEWTGR